MNKKLLFMRALVLLVILAVAGCAAPGKKTGIGALGGAALGAGTGAIIGSATGDAGRGTAIGAGMGALAGGLLGNTLDQRDEELEQQRQTLAQQQSQLEENRRLIEELQRRGADVRGTRRGVVVNLPDILFQFDRYNLTPEAHRTVGEIADVLRQVRHRHIAVEGHTDSIGTMAYNKQLSLNRARSVAEKLERSGVARGQMSVTGFGEGSPIATNNTSVGRERNRRVEIVVENR